MFMILMIIVSLFVYILGIATVRYNLFPYPQLLSLKNSVQVDKSKKYLENKYVKLHEIYATQSADIVMLGDSLTSNVNWSELFDRPIINRGVGGDVTDGYLHRMSFIYKLKPKKVFMNGGTNDFVAGYSVEQVLENYKLIIKNLQDHEIKPYMQSVVYTSFDEINNKITQINLLLQQYCNDNNIVYIDLNKGLAKDKKLIDKYTIDGSHLNARGYEVWKNEIKDYIF